MEVVSKKIRLRKSWPERREENPGERRGMCKDTEEGASIFEKEQLVRDNQNLDYVGKSKGRREEVR